MIYKPGDILFSEYRVEASLGQGRYGHVYLVENQGLHELRALKVLQRDLPGVNPQEYVEIEKRFELEARLGASLAHRAQTPHLLQVHRLIPKDGQLALELEYAEGGSLRLLLDHLNEENKRLPIVQAVEYACQAAEGLAELHRLNLVHRDVKPSNLLLDQHGRVKVADFGLVQDPYLSFRQELSNPPPHPGTPAYMSPEQKNSTDLLTSASDVYALGLVLFELLTLRNPSFLKPGTRLHDLRPDAPDWLGELLTKMLARDPAARPWDGAEAAGLLRTGLAEEQAQRETEQEAAASAVRQQVVVEEAARQTALRTQQVKDLLHQEEAGRSKREQINTDKRKEDAARRQQAKAALAHRVRQALTYLLSLALLVLLVLGGWKLVEGALEAQQAEQTRVAQLASSQTSAVSLPTQPPPQPSQTRTPSSTSQPTYTPSPPSSTTLTATLMPSPTSYPALIMDGRMVLIPAGSFLMGSDTGSADEQPVHKVSLDAFYMDTYEVTNDQYAQCVAAGICEAPSCSSDRNNPVACIFWDQAKAYCEWIGGRLPTEAEWEYAARGGLEGKLYPWGDDSPICQAGAINGANFGYCPTSGTIAVGSYAANGYGLYDMVGNVGEMVNDLYDWDYYAISPLYNPTGPETGSLRSVRGGSWHYDTPRYSRVTHRSYIDPLYRFSFIGFRCARDP
ncbi:MAG: bifunctional serine/threonine-protein kinase/formylglycine-generating enzyme family protein [Anaerolineales bacterium]|jgi:formylglycine-generating enzyme required for sulfatase activity|nr:bifunctional serine/threonine-protein kinase/formylglycine-generating enzyme family protein [Anaerolineales bacterium]